jgi:hypothetical protein
MACEDRGLIKRSQPIFPLIRELGKGIHRDVERAVHNTVDNFRNPSNNTLIYRFAQGLGKNIVIDFKWLGNHNAITPIYGIF